LEDDGGKCGEAMNSIAPSRGGDDMGFVSEIEEKPKL
jgi:hypothetical protein